MHNLGGFDYLMPQGHILLTAAVQSCLSFVLKEARMGGAENKGKGMTELKYVKLNSS